MRYVEWDKHKLASEHLANPIQYAYLKDLKFAQEKELRITLSALGLGNFTWNGQAFEFPPSVQVQFDFRHAFADRTITELRKLPDFNDTDLKEELMARGISTA